MLELTHMNADDLLRLHVIGAIGPLVQVTDASIGVHVHQGTVTLTGHIADSGRRVRIEAAARAVSGVRALVCNAPMQRSTSEPATMRRAVGSGESASGVRANHDTGRDATTPMMKKAGTAVAHTVHFTWDDGSGQTHCTPLYLEVRDFHRVACGHAADARLNGRVELAEDFDQKARVLARQMADLRAVGHVGRSLQVSQTVFHEAFAHRAGESLSIL